MFTIMLIFHTMICVFLVIVILMQASKGEGLAGAFGGGGGGISGAVFGGRGAGSFLSKATTVLAIVFMINCSVLAFMSSRQAGVTSGSSTSIVVEEAQKDRERQATQQQALPTTSDNSEGSLFPTGDAPTEGTDGIPAEGSESSLFPSDATTQEAEPAGTGQ